MLADTSRMTLEVSIQGDTRQKIRKQGGGTMRRLANNLWKKRKGSNVKGRTDKIRSAELIDSQAGFRGARG